MKISAIISSIILLATLSCFSQNWTHHSSFSKTSSIIDLSIGQAGNVYLLTSDRQVFRSSDNGNTWIPFIETPSWLNALTIKASKVSNRVFVKTNCCGVAYTDNFGANWFWDNLFTSTSGLGLSPNGIDVFQTKTAAVTQRLGTSGFIKELYTSNSNGANSTWNLTHTFPAGGNSPKNVFLLNNSLIFASFAFANNNLTVLRVSNNGGTSFTDISFFNGKDIVDLLITPSQTIYCATNTTTSGELYESTDFGNTWTTVTPPTTTTKIIKLTYDDVNNLLYAVTEDGIYRKTTTGNWEIISAQANLVTIGINANQDILTGGLIAVGVQKSTLNPIDFNTIEIGGDFSPAWMTVSGTSIFTGNSGNPIISNLEIDTPNDWQHTAIQNVPLSAEAIRFGATVGSFAAGVKNNGDITISGNNYIANMDANLSFNIIADEASGAPLAPISSPAFVPLNLKLSNNDEILIKQLNANYIDLFSNGTTWSVLNPVAGQATKQILNFCAGTTNYYVSTNDFSQTFGDEVHYSTNGTTWNSIPLPNSITQQGIFIDKQDNLYLLASSPLALYRLDMANQQWILTNLNLDNDSNTYFELAFDNNNRMYALNFKTTSATSTSQGIAFSDDQGVSWTYAPFPTENGNTIFLESLGFDNNNILYAKTSNDDNNEPSITKGIYSFEEALSVADFDKVPIKIYPNPFSGYFNVEMKGSGIYYIHDLLGREISSGKITEGNNRIEFQKNIARGIYVFSIKTNNYNFSQKIIFENK